MAEPGCRKCGKCAIVRRDGNAIENEAHSFVNFINCVRLIEAMVRVFDVESPKDSIPKSGVETANIGMELIDNANAIFLDEVQSNCGIGDDRQ